MVTDRPDQTESAWVVPKGYVQLEAGYFHSSDELDSDAFPELLVRIGLLRKLELRVNYQGYQWQEQPGGESDSGWGNGGLAVKYEFAEGHGVRPAVGLLVGATIPAGGAKFTTGRPDPSVLLLMAHELSSRLSLGYNAGVVWSTTEDPPGERDTLASFRWTAALGISATKKLGTFVELFGRSPFNDERPAEASFDAGVGYLLKPNLQLDAAVGVGLNDAAQDWFLTVGLSHRWPR